MLRVYRMLVTMRKRDQSRKSASRKGASWKGNLPEDHPSNLVMVAKGLAFLARNPKLPNGVQRNLQNRHIAQMYRWQYGIGHGAHDLDPHKLPADAAGLTEEELQDHRHGKLTAAWMRKKGML